MIAKLDLSGFKTILTVERVSQALVIKNAITCELNDGKCNKYTIEGSDALMITRTYADD